MPTDSRMRSSGSVRWSAGMEAWLMVQGISQRLLTLPKDTVVLKILQASQNRLLNSTEPVVRLIMEPCPVDCDLCNARSSFEQPPRPGKKAAVMRGCAMRKAATCAALSCARITRRCIVLMPRRNKKHSKGASAVPSAFCKKATRCARFGSRTQTSPPVQSACPEKNFVAEWTTMSAPNVSGLQMTGGIMVLSTLRSTLCSCAKAASFRRSDILIRGFEGLSVCNKRVFFVSTFSTALRSVVSTKTTLMPEKAQSCVSRRCMPP
mmetsp:Transcript_107227/g.272132  ORF Transcript_107227/g.272132 Transcript_107227/m.272132 type:complete len:264 (+) Transcript_107227:379-1170(+)